MRRLTVLLAFLLATGANANVLRVNEWLRREMIGGSVWQIDAEIEPLSGTNAGSAEDEDV